MIALRRGDHVGFFAGAALEMGTRPGPVKERVATFQSGLVGLIRQFAAEAQARQQLPADEDPDQLAFELNGVILAANTSFVMYDDAGALDMARQIVRRRLGVEAKAPRPSKSNQRRATRSPKA